MSGGSSKGKGLGSGRGKGGGQRELPLCGRGPLDLISLMKQCIIPPPQEQE